MAIAGSLPPDGPALDWAAPMPELLRTWRARLGLTQDRAAAALDVPIGTLRDWEQGRRAPSPDGPLRLALRSLADRAG